MNGRTAPQNPNRIPQNGYPQNGYAPDSYPQNGYPQNGYAQNNYPQNGYPQNNYPQNGYPPNPQAPSRPMANQQNPFRRPPSQRQQRQAGPGQAGRYPNSGRNPANPTGQRSGSRAGAAAVRPPRVDPETRRREKARAEMEQTVRARKKTEAREKRIRGLRAMGRFAVYVLCAVLLLIIVAGGGVLIALHHTPSAPLSTGKISFYYGGTKVRTEAATRCLDDDDLYVCFNDLADYLGMKETGSAQEMKFVLRTNDNPLDSSAGDGTEESVVFYTYEHRVVINGQVELLDVPNLLVGEEIWVSTEFLTEWMENLSVSYKPNQRTVKVSRILDEEQSDPENKITVYLPISFRLKKNDPLESIEEDPGVGLLADSMREATAYELAFQTDLSEYEEYMNPKDELRDAFLILVNADHPLSSGDVPRDLKDVINTSSARNTQQLREYPTRALEALFREMRHYGYYDMAVYSGYRSYDYQATIFEQYVQNEMASNPNLSREDAEALVLTYSTRPGTSEHQTGLAVDMDTMGSFTTDFAWTTEYYWLQENAWKFGFVLRFPSDKVDVTKISFEPWHYRYVGRYHAKIIRDNGLCLEEYIARISN
ncbi:MAG: D-alanyl-D-alanine carboxypeptidase family protein [Clostridia bacterium]|nr:D-alanyl-D-alanine carboxypeptidase family protein [Clostridia bacterium]